MTPSKPVFNLGIVGGCMSHQSDISMSNLYHRRMKARLLEATGIDLKVHIVRDFTLSYHERLESLLSAHPLDAVFLHVRVKYTRKAGVLVANNANGRIDYFLHPALRSRNGGRYADWEAEGFKGHTRLFSRRAGAPRTDDEDERVLEGSRLFGLSLKPINLAAGALMGLGDWAIEDELKMVEVFRDTCRAKGLPFFVMGPTPSPNQLGTEQLVCKMNRRLTETLPAMGVPLAIFDTPVDAQGRRLVQNSGYFLTADGQAHVAELLYPQVERLAAEKVGAINTG